MAENSAIEWTDATWNPTTGCTRVSEGCRNCYAFQLHDMRHKAFLEGKQLPAQYAKPFKELQLFEDRLTDPLSWRKPKRIFVNSMSDLFHKDVPETFIDRVFAAMALAEWHTYQILTKRPERMAAYTNDPQTPFRVAKAADAMQVSIAAAKTPPSTRLLPGKDNYYASNDGTIYTTNGSGRCVWCGTTFDHGQQDSRFCGTKCRSASHYAKSQGRNHEPAGATMRRVKPDPGEDGHLRVMLIGHGKELVHRLILSTFDREPVDGEQGCHIDGNPGNCHIANLHWGTQADNWRDRRRHGAHRSYQKLNEEEVEAIRSMVACGHPAEQVGREFGVSGTQVRNIIRGSQWAITSTIEWPLPGVWFGTSVENQATADERIPHLLRAPAAVRFLSCEPLLGPVDLRQVMTREGRVDAIDGAIFKDDLLSIDPTSPSAWPVDFTRQLHWVIVGGESGPGARPCRVEWIRDIVRQCRDAGVPVFVKQLGSFIVDRNDRGFDATAETWADGPDEGKPTDPEAWPDMPDLEEDLDGTRDGYQGAPVRVRLVDRKGGDMAEWPADLQVREFPVVKAGVA